MYKSYIHIHIYIYNRITVFRIHLKLAHCKSTVLQLKQKKCPKCWFQA